MSALAGATLRSGTMRLRGPSCLSPPNPFLSPVSYPRRNTVQGSSLPTPPTDQRWRVIFVAGPSAGTVTDGTFTWTFAAAVATPCDIQCAANAGVTTTGTNTFIVGVLDG